MHSSPRPGACATAGGSEQVAFVEGLIEEPPADPGSVDVVISNGVVNLAPDKQRVFDAAARALRPGGRIALADIVSARELRERNPAQRRAVGGMHRRRRPAGRLPGRDRGGRPPRGDDRPERRLPASSRRARNPPRPRTA